MRFLIIRVSVSRKREKRVVRIHLLQAARYVAFICEKCR